MNRFISLVFVVLAPALVSAKTFTNENYGYTIDIDDGYQLSRNDSATYFRSKDNDVVVVIRNWPGLDQATAKDYLQYGYQDERFAIVADGQLEEMVLEEGKGFLIGIKGVVDRRPMKGLAAAYVGNGGQGLVLIVSGPENSWDQLSPAARKTAASITFIDFKPGPDLREWHQMLAGSRLSFRGDIDEDRRVSEDLNLCSDSSFRHRISTSSIRDSGPGSAIDHSTKSRYGRWRVVDDGGAILLLLHYDGGRDESGVIEYVDGRIHIDGRRYERLRKSSCR